MSRNENERPKKTSKLTKLIILFNFYYSRTDILYRNDKTVTVGYFYSVEQFYTGCKHLIVPREFNRFFFLRKQHSSFGYILQL